MINSRMATFFSFVFFVLVDGYLSLDYKKIIISTSTGCICLSH